MKIVTIQREAQHPSPAGEGRVRGIRKGIFAYLILLSPALSIRRGGKLLPICGFSDSLNSYQTNYSDLSCSYAIKINFAYPKQALDSNRPSDRPVEMDALLRFHALQLIFLG